MKLMNQFATFAVAGLALCVFAPNGSAQGTSAAESACMSAVNSNYGGRVSNLEVVSSEYSEAGSVVIVQADGDRFRCLSSNSGEVEDLSVESQSSSSSQEGTSAAESACMSAVNKNYGGRVSNLEVVSSEYSEAGSVVIVQADGDRWHCLSSNRGEVEDLSVE